MKISVDCYMMKRAFEDWNRDYYSLNGCEALLEYFDEVDENMEFDVIAICCDCTEYGEHGAACSFDNLISDYEYLLNSLEWMEEQKTKWGADIGDDFDEVKDMYLDDLVEKLEEHTTVLRVSNGNYIVFAF